MKKFTCGLFVFAFVLVSLFTTFSCKSTSFAVPETSDRMYWNISGTDSKGNPSTVHILGTIHVGDERLYPLPDQVMEDFKNADRIVAELSSADMDAMQGALIKALVSSMIRANGRNVLKELDEEEKDILFSVLDENIARSLAIYEPWLLTNTVSVFQYGSCGLDGAKGVDQYLMDIAKKENREWEGLDTLDLQLKVIQFGTYDEQLAVLKSILDILVDPTIFNEYINALYEAYLAADLEGLLSVHEIEDEMDSSDPMLEEYSKRQNEELLTKRNKSWAEKIKGYLNEGGETFIFAGSLHFIGPDSVFYYLNKNGVLK